MASTTTTKVNPLYTSIPIIQRVISFTPSKKLSNPIKLASVCSSWEETCKVYGGGSLVWLHEAEKNNKKSVEKLVSFFHKACAAPGDVALWVVKQLLQLGVVDPIATDRAGFQGLHFATRYGNKKIFDLLLFHHFLYPFAYENRQQEIKKLLLSGGVGDENVAVAENANNNNPRRIVSMYAPTTKSNYTIIDLAAETAQSEFIQFLICERNYNPAKNTSPKAPNECENAASHLLENEWDGKYFVTMMTAFKKKWEECPALSESELQMNVAEDADDPRYKMAELLLRDDENDQNEELHRHHTNNKDDDQEEDDDLGFGMIFTRSASTMGYIETNNDDKELARLLSPQFYDTFAAVKKVKQTTRRTHLHIDHMFVTTTVPSRFAPTAVLWNKTPLHSAVQHGKHTAALFLLDNFSDSCDVLRPNASIGTSIFFQIVQSCKYNFASVSVADLRNSDIAVQSVQGNLLMKVMEMSDAALLKQKIAKTEAAESKENDDKKDDDDASSRRCQTSSIKLEPNERTIECRMTPGDESTPTPFLAACKSSYGRYGIGLMQFLIIKCGANPLAETKHFLASEPTSSTPAAVAAAQSETTSNNEVAKQNYYVEDALFYACSLWKSYGESSELPSVIKLLVSEGCDAYRKTGKDRLAVIERMEQQLTTLLAAPKVGSRTNYGDRSVQNLTDVMSKLKPAIEEGLQIRKERLMM